MIIDKDILYRRIFFTCFWIWATYGFIQDEILPFLSHLHSIVYLGLDAVLIALGVLCLRERRDKIYAIIFVTLAFVSTCIVNGLSLLNFVNGIREVIPIIFALPIIRYLCRTPQLRSEFVESFDKQLYKFLILQAPCIMFQFLKYGANDHGGGSLGNWSSGTVSTCIYLISFYLISKKWNKDAYFTSLIENKWYIILLLPTFFNETKVSFLFFALYFLMLMKFDKVMIVRLIIASPLVAIGIYLGAMMYGYATGNNTDLTSMEFYQEYLAQEDSDDIIMLAEMLEQGDFGDDDDWSVDVARFTKIALTPDILYTSSKGGLMLGAGVSHFKGGTTLKQTELAREYHWAFSGTIPYISFIVMQLGLLGLMICLYRYIPVARLRNPNCVRYPIVYTVLVIIVIMMYNTSLNTPLLNIIIFNMFLNCGWNYGEQAE